MSCIEHARPISKFVHAMLIGPEFVGTLPPYTHPVTASVVFETLQSTRCSSVFFFVYITMYSSKKVQPRRQVSLPVILSLRSHRLNDNSQSNDKSFSRVLGHRAESDPEILLNRDLCLNYFVLWNSRVYVYYFSLTSHSSRHVNMSSSPYSVFL
jgi:hypothetical protein